MTMTTFVWRQILSSLSTPTRPSPVILVVHLCFRWITMFHEPAPNQVAYRYINMHPGVPDNQRSRSSELDNALGFPGPSRRFFIWFDGKSSNSHDAHSRYELYPALSPLISVVLQIDGEETVVQVNTLGKTGSTVKVKELNTEILAHAIQAHRGLGTQPRKIYGICGTEFAGSGLYPTFWRAIYEKPPSR
ncbi:hypothetical protein HGRIS_007330 [Hohenbuehelia grisea]|uniref:Uncharacterized protein n=1 Tax=Hohenbuehelia grisea TaxID=104357 RepID=A0ABR3J4U1_9AGAR